MRPIREIPSPQSSNIAKELRNRRLEPHFVEPKGEDYEIGEPETKVRVIGLDSDRVQREIYTGYQVPFRRGRRYEVITSRIVGERGPDGWKLGLKTHMSEMGDRLKRYAKKAKRRKLTLGIGTHPDKKIKDVVLVSQSPAGMQADAGTMERMAESVAKKATVVESAAAADAVVTGTMLASNTGNPVIDTLLFAAGVTTLVWADRRRRAGKRDAKTFANAGKLATHMRNVFKIEGNPNYQVIKEHVKGQ